MSSRHRRSTSQAGATLWTGSSCAGCPAAPVCPSIETSDACTDPALYDPSAAHPTKLAFPASRMDFEYPNFRSGGVVVEVVPRPRARVLTLSDGVHTGTIRLKGVLARLRTGKGAGSDAMAVLHGHDPRLFGLLELRAQLGPLLIEAGFTSVISPCFSTWESYPPWESLLNQALTARLATELAEHLPTIPSVGWRRHEELPRWVEWLLRNQRRSFALHPATMRTQREWDWWIEGLRTMRALLASDGASPPHLFVNGPSTAQRVSEVVRVWHGDVTFLTQQPWQLALHGKVLSEDLNEVPEDRDGTVLERLRVSATNFDHFVRTVDPRKATPGGLSSNGSVGTQDDGRIQDVTRSTSPTAYPLVAGL